VYDGLLDTVINCVINLSPLRSYIPAGLLLFLGVPINALLLCTAALIRFSVALVTLPNPSVFALLGKKYVSTVPSFGKPEKYFS